jgi:hypothetical protein
MNRDRNGYMQGQHSRHKLFASSPVQAGAVGMNFRGAILSRIGNYLSDILRLALLLAALCANSAQAQIHVSPKGSDLAAGTGDI